MLTLTAHPDTYIYPPRAKGALPRDGAGLLAELGWLAQYKFNDGHLLLKLLPDRIEFWTRHGELFRSYTPPDWLPDQLRAVQELLGLDRRQYHLLDGGLLDTKHHAIKDTVAVWDILVRDGEHLLGTSYRSRYDSLWGPVCSAGLGHFHMPGVPDEPVGVLAAPKVFVPLTLGPQHWPKMWEVVDRVNRPFDQPLLEGLMYKCFEWALEAGFREDNNSAWMVRSRVQTRRHLY